MIVKKFLPPFIYIISSASLLAVSINNEFYISVVICFLVALAVSDHYKNIYSGIYKKKDVILIYLKITLLPMLIASNVNNDFINKIIVYISFLWFFSIIFIGFFYKK